MAPSVRQRISRTRYTKDLLDVATLSRQQVLDLLRLAISLKKKQRQGTPHRLLPGAAREDIRIAVSKAVD